MSTPEHDARLLAKRKALVKDTLEARDLAVKALSEADEKYRRALWDLIYAHEDVKFMLEQELKRAKVSKP